MKNLILSKNIITLFLSIIFLFTLFAFNISAADAKLTREQVQAIIALLESFGADHAVINKVRLALEGKTLSIEYENSTRNVDNTITTCPSFTRTLYIGKKGEDVMELQKFLKSLGYFDYPEFTTYFGPVTRDALRKYQCKYMNICYGTEMTTGYGVLGPKTRASIRSNCYSRMQQTKNAKTNTSIGIAEGDMYIQNRSTSGTVENITRANRGTPCFINDTEIEDGKTITLYSRQYASQCELYAQRRTCINGKLTGDNNYLYLKCAPPVFGGGGGGSISPTITQSDLQQNETAGKYTGNNYKSLNLNKELYTMFSAYKLEPYSSKYIDGMLSTLGRSGISGILYSSMGYLSKRIKDGEVQCNVDGKPCPYNDEISFNNLIFDKAKQYNANMWLQLVVYNNKLKVGNKPLQTYSAHDILVGPGNREIKPEGKGWCVTTENKDGTGQVLNYSLKCGFKTYEQLRDTNNPIQNAFLDRVAKEVKPYIDFVVSSSRSVSEANRKCRIIVFEEASIFHAPQGSGAFWSAPQDCPIRNDDWFANNGYSENPSLYCGELGRANIPQSQRKAYHKLFAGRMANIFTLVKHKIDEVVQATPGISDCKVGIHIGHAVFYDESDAYTRLLATGAGLPDYNNNGRPDNLKELGIAPEFIFYDLYQEVNACYAPDSKPYDYLYDTNPYPGDNYCSSPGASVYTNNLYERAKKIETVWGLPAYYLAQLHTTNKFGKGYGRTPSRNDLDNDFALATSRLGAPVPIKIDVIDNSYSKNRGNVIGYERKTYKGAGFDGFGYYMVDTVKTLNDDPIDLVCLNSDGSIKNMCKSSSGAGSFAHDLVPDQNALSPNVFGKSTVYESGHDRWEYGITKLLEAKGTDFSKLFDLVLYGRFTNGVKYYKVYLKNQQTGRWDYISHADPVEDRDTAKATVDVLRNLPIDKYMKDGNVYVRFVQENTSNLWKNGYLTGLYIVRSNPSKDFVFPYQFKQDIEEVTDGTDAYRIDNMQKYGATVHDNAQGYLIFSSPTPLNKASNEFIVTLQ